MLRDTRFTQSTLHRQCKQGDKMFANQSHFQFTTNLLLKQTCIHLLHLSSQSPFTFLVTFIQFYLRMSAIQSSHRRVVLLHCDQVTTKRIIDTAHQLDLFSGQKIWVLLDGVIGSQVTSATLWKHLQLPNGMLALHQRPPSLTDSGNTLFAIIKVIGEALANTLVNSRSWSGLDNDFHNGTAPAVSCWKNASSARIKYSQVVYRFVCV